MSKEVCNVEWKWGITVASKKLSNQADTHLQVQFLALAPLKNFPNYNRSVIVSTMVVILRQNCCILFSLQSVEYSQKEGSQINPVSFQLNLQLKDKNNEKENVSVEMTLEQYYEFLLEMEKAKLAIESQS